MAKNPGKNIKGQKCRAKKHFSGKISTEYVEDSKKRSETKSKRIKTIKEKMKELSQKSGMEILMQWKDGKDAPVETFKTENCTIAAVPTGTPSFEADVHTETDAIYPDPPTANAEIEEGDKCNVCHKSHIGNRRTCKWVKCIERKCEWWVHALCVGLTGISEELKHLKYMCPEHVEKLISKKK